MQNERTYTFILLLTTKYIKNCIFILRHGTLKINLMEFFSTRSARRVIVNPTQPKAHLRRSAGRGRWQRSRAAHESECSGINRQGLLADQISSPSTGGEGCHSMIARVI